MSVFHDEVEIEDFEYDEEMETYYYPCPCGDQFEITKVSDLLTFMKFSLVSLYMVCTCAVFIFHSQEDLENGEEIAECPSCSLIVKVIYDSVWEINTHTLYTQCHAIYLEVSTVT